MIEFEHEVTGQASLELITLLKDIGRRSQVHAQSLPKQVEFLNYWEGILFSVGGNRLVARWDHGFITAGKARDSRKESS